MAAIKPKLVVLLLSLVIVIAAVAYVFINIYIIGLPTCGTDLLQVGYNTTYNPQNNTLLLEVKSSKNQAYNLNRVTVKNSAGQVLVNRDIDPTELSPYGARNITIDLDGYTFASGEYYSVELGTLEGINFKSILNVYEKVKTEISNLTADTISVYIQSHANQTLTFTKATIYKSPSTQQVNEQESSNNYPIQVTLSPQIELLPNYNTTITVPYKNGLIAGNYTVYLHSEPPLVLGAMTNFAVSGMEDWFNQTSTR